MQFMNVSEDLSEAVGPLHFAMDSLIGKRNSKCQGKNLGAAKGRHCR